MTGFLKRIFSRKNKSKNAISSPSSQPKKATILSRDMHNVSRNKMSKSALKVLYKLNEAGYESYLVGGGVRDILLGLRPKDFDVATDATPEEVHRLFRNSRLIGRRFKIVHILYGREVIEVATFRAGHEQAASQVSPQSNHQKKPSKNDLTRKSDHGMLMRDNVYGTMEEDAFRRDFTVNALYYTVKGFSVIDYTQGLKDLEDGLIRFIGDPKERYREDPVRILRAIRLSCKLNLQIEKETAKPISELAELLTHVSSARLWDECNKMLLAGKAEKTWQSLCDHGVAQYLFEQTVHCMNNKNSTGSEASQEFKKFIKAALQSTDKRIANKQPVNPAFLFAVFLWKPQQELTAQLIAKGLPPYEATQKAAAKVMTIQSEAIGIPKRFSIVAKEVWAMQFRLNNLRRKSVNSLIEHPRFRAAYDFLCLRAGDDIELQELAQWWTDYQDADENFKNKMLNSVINPPTKKRKNYRKKRKAVNHTSSTQ